MAQEEINDDEIKDKEAEGTEPLRYGGKIMDERYLSEINNILKSKNEKNIKDINEFNKLKTNNEFLKVLIGYLYEKLADFYTNKNDTDYENLLREILDKLTYELFLNDNKYYYQLLSSSLDYKTQEKNIQLLANNKLFTNNYFIQPMEKGYWENSAKVLKLRGYPEIESVLSEMLEWIQDLNWPGTQIIIEIFESIPKDVIIHYIETAIKEADSKNDEMWLYWLKYLIDDLKITENDFIDKKLYNILDKVSE